MFNCNFKIHLNTLKNIGILLKNIGMCQIRLFDCKLEIHLHTLKNIGILLKNIEIFLENPWNFFKSYHITDSDWCLIALFNCNFKIHLNTLKKIGILLKNWNTFEKLEYLLKTLEFFQFQNTYEYFEKHWNVWKY